MISKRLFEKVTGYLDDTEDIDVHGNRSQKVGYKGFNKNIFEVVNLVELWAINEGYVISATVDGNADLYRIGEDILDTFYVDYNRPEVVFMSAEAVIEDMKRKKDES